MGAFAGLPLGMKLIIGAMVLLLVGAAASVPFIAVTGIGEDEGGNGDAALAIQRILSLGSDEEQEIDVRLGRLHADFPSDLPRFKGDVIASIRSLGQDGLGFIVLYESKRTPSEIIEYFEKFAADKQWDVSSGTRAEDSASIQFAQPNGDIQGLVNVSLADPRNANDDRFSVVLSVIDHTLGELPPERAERVFNPDRSETLPRDYPRDRVPSYPDAAIIASGFFHQPQGSAFFLTAVTRDNQEDVIRFYQAQLARAGWTVDRPIEDAAAIELNFSDPRRAETEGTIKTDVFLRDTKYTEISIQFSIGSSSAPRPTPTAVPTAIGGASTPSGSPAATATATATARPG